MLEEQALKLRQMIVRIASIAGAGHITSSLSSLDIISVLYLGGILRYNPKDPEWMGRDRFVLSKGHAALALYCVLAEAGFFPTKDLNTFCGKGSDFGGLTTTGVPGVECYTGSLGHGLSFAVGYALSAKIQNRDTLVYALTGDGECQEGTIWEAAMSITQMNLNNLVWIIDKNNIQLSGRVQDIMSLEPLDEKLISFGFDVVTINGHDFDEIMNALRISRVGGRKPLAVIANTVKGAGVPFLEDKLGWHGRKPNDEELQTIIGELGLTPEEFGVIA